MYREYTQKQTYLQKSPASHYIRVEREGERIPAVHPTMTTIRNNQRQPVLLVICLLLRQCQLLHTFSLSVPIGRTTGNHRMGGGDCGQTMIHFNINNNNDNIRGRAASLTSSKSTTRQFLSSSPEDDHQKRRVVVTGLGVISGCGIGATDFFNACCDGISSLRKVQRFDIQHYPCQIASEVPEELFDPAQFFVNPKNIKSNDRYTHFAVAAARQALQDGQYGDTPDTLIHPERIGVMVGTAFGGMETFEQETLKLHKKPERPKVRKRPLTCD